jgi:cell division protease FtsH
VRRGQIWVLVAFILLLAFVFMAVSTPLQALRATRQLSMPELVAMTEKGEIASVEFHGPVITATRTDGGKVQATGPEDPEFYIQYFSDQHIVPAFVRSDARWLPVVSILIPVIVCGAFMMMFMRQIQQGNGRAISFGKSKAKLLTDSGRRVTFEDVAGCEEAKEELQEIILFLREPGRFTRLGGRIPKGVLLMGSPGAGKTLLARAVAGEAGVPFYSLSGSEFVEMFVGVGASRVRDLFEQARRQSPCIVFIDEIDAIGRHRGGMPGGGQEERDQTLNQLLVEMDGFEANDTIILMAATNRPDVLDPALLRPGRFDRRVVVPAPDVRGRLGILQVHARKTPLAESVDLERIARGTPGFSGADLENLINEAALLAARHDKQQIEQIDLERAKDKVAMGAERRSMVLSDEQKRLVAYHETGHALVARMSPHADPVNKITIVPRGRALGVTQYLPDEDRVTTRPRLVAMLANMLGGRAAEEVAFGDISTGAYDDIRKATQIARAMVCDYGMSSVGVVSLGEMQEQPFLGTSARSRDFSEATAERIDAEVARLLDEAYAHARGVLTQNRHILDRVAQILLERETLDGPEFERIVDSLHPVLPHVA